MLLVFGNSEVRILIFGVLAKTNLVFLRLRPGLKCTLARHKRPIILSLIRIQRSNQTPSKNVALLKKNGRPCRTLQHYLSDRQGACLHQYPERAAAMRHLCPEGAFRKTSMTSAVKKKNASSSTTIHMYFP